jgi:hypothetical protein
MNQIVKGKEKAHVQLLGDNSNITKLLTYSKYREMLRENELKC